MRDYIRNDQQGQFFAIGTLFLIAGYIAMFAGTGFERYLFYISMFFLGFYAARDAVIETVEKKSPNVDLLMILAALGALLINYESEGAMLLLIFSGAEVLEDYVNGRSVSSIKELMEHVPDTAQRLLDDGTFEEVETHLLQVGDRVIVARGAQVPIDGQVNRESLVNESALTGESVPVEKSVGDEVFAGTINEGHAFYVDVTKTADDTIFSSIIRMVEEAQGRPSRVSRFIDKIESKYVIGVLIAVPVFIALLYYGFNTSFQDAFYRGMVFLTVASPCALVASATPATLSAISNGAKNGVLFKGGVAMEALADMKTLFTDKTGTLTRGEFAVEEYSASNEVLAEVVFMEQQSSHPIADAIVAHFSDVDLSIVNKEELVEEIVGSGMKKGDLIVGKPASFDQYNDPHNFREKTISGNTMVFVGKDNQIIAFFSMADQVRLESEMAIDNFQKDGIEVIMITGDNEQTAKKVAAEVGVDSYYANCSPEDKNALVIEEQNEGHIVGMIGDGINDAPSLALADIGIGMGSGSRAATESSDVVIVKNDLNKLYYSYKLSEKLRTVIKQNVIFAVAVIIVLVFLNLFGLISLPFAVLFHEGSTILVILNGLRLLKEEDRSTTF